MAMPMHVHAPVSKGCPATMEATPETQPARKEWSVGTTGQDCVFVGDVCVVLCRSVGCGCGGLHLAPHARHATDSPQPPPPC